MYKNNKDFLTVDKVMEFLMSDNRHIECPYCKSKNWFIVTDDDKPTEKTYAAITPLKSTKNNETLYYSVVCQHCGHLSLINTYFVDLYFAKIIKDGIQ